MENLLEASGFMEDRDEASGLSEDYNEFTSKLTGMEVWRSFCNSLTKSIDITLVRRKRSQTNESNPLDSEANPPFQNMKKKVIAKKTQLYDQASSKFYTPMNECAPCWTIVTAISGLAALAVIHSVVLCALCVKLKTARKHLREAMEME